MLTIEKTNLNKVKLIKPDIFEDHRGSHIETYNEKDYCEHEIDMKFVQHNISISKKHVLRGLHGDDQTWKLVSCVFGEFMLAVVNYDHTSDQYLQWQTFILSDRNRYQILIPPHFANGHLVLSDKALFSYKQSTYYAPERQFTLKWDDPTIGIDWPIENPILSERDKTALTLNEYQSRKDGIS